MKNNNNQYINVIFRNVTITKYSKDLNEQLTVNLLARYDDNI